MEFCVMHNAVLNRIKPRRRDQQFGQNWILLRGMADEVSPPFEGKLRQALLRQQGCPLPEFINAKGD